MWAVDYGMFEILQPLEATDVVVAANYILTSCKEKTIHEIIAGCCSTVECLN